MNLTSELQKQLEQQAQRMIDKGVPAYDAYMAVYQVSELLKSYLLSVGQRDWRKFWKISLYFNSRAGEALEA